MRIATQNLQNIYVKRFMAIDIVKELYFVGFEQILKGIFFISQWNYMVRPIKRLEILPGMRISTRNLQNFYVKIFMAKNIVKELYIVDFQQILKGISFISNGKR